MSSDFLGTDVCERCTVCGVLACCFFCEDCPLYQYYAEADDGSGLYLTTPATVQGTVYPAQVGEPVVYGAVPPPVPAPAAQADNQGAQGSYHSVPVQPAASTTPTSTAPAREMKTFDPAVADPHPKSSKYEDSIL